MSETTAHYATTRPAERKYRVIFGGRTIVESDAAIELREHHAGRDYDPVIYFPAAALDGLDTSASARTTRCPIKGEASYLNYGETGDAIWCYREPLAGVAAIGNYYAFDPDKGFRVVAGD